MPWNCAARLPAAELLAYGPSTNTCWLVEGSVPSHSSACHSWSSTSPACWRHSIGVAPWTVGGGAPGVVVVGVVGEVVVGGAVAVVSVVVVAVVGVLALPEVVVAPVAGLGAGAAAPFRARRLRCGVDGRCLRLPSPARTSPARTKPARDGLCPHQSRDRRRLHRSHERRYRRSSSCSAGAASPRRR